ncbi:hypothetical protein [Bacillus badius]|uniref:Uncharacterized protein n=1 Tax=Bacillus badius TaxID=1455 RepID=A0ABR5AS81_BACBA|nr:hypothetical protein [Bacillus badius]KIL74105.1 hypothetical protein SD78_3163 [Bacillus badius]KIL77519.1 hypothetical protein SD77_1505 [Bacillus badius]KZN99311.1 hypothetical protein A4244_19155 [Bacillus badius]KZR58563.1 hypothetical protein A3781_16870 [Bacillus badius]MED0668530.1 hypothetical protein [Bacillus badius]
MAKFRKQNKRQLVKMDGFRFPHQLLEELRTFQKDKNKQVPASAYAVLLSILKQIHIEKNSQGKVQEFNLAFWSKKLHVAYSTMHAGRKFLEEHGFLYEEVLANGLPAWVLANYKEYTTPELKAGHELNYFIVPHTLLDTTIVAEFVRTSNPEAFELMFSLFNQFRHGIAKLDHKNEVAALEQSRTMATLKDKLKKRAKGVREVLAILQPLFEVEYTGVQVRGRQLWIRKVLFRLKSECVKENTDEFHVEPLLAKFQENTLYVLDGLKLRYKPRDLFDIMLSFKQEVLDIVKFLIDENESEGRYTYRDAWAESLFFRCLDQFEQHIKTQMSKRGKFSFHTSIGAYFRTIYRRELPQELKKIPYDKVHQAKYTEYLQTGKVPALHWI